MGEPGKRESGVGTKVLKYFADRPGDIVFIEDMRAALNLRDVQITSAIHHLSKRGRRNVRAIIETVNAGQSWRYLGMDDTQNVPEKQTQTRTEPLRVFEEIGTTRDGSLIIQATDGKLYRATEM